MVLCLAYSTHYGRRPCLLRVFARDENRALPHGAPVELGVMVPTSISCLSMLVKLTSLAHNLFLLCVLILRHF